MTKHIEDALLLALPHIDTPHILGERYFVDALRFVLFFFAMPLGYGMREC